MLLKVLLLQGKAAPERVPEKNAFTIMRHESETGLEKRTAPQIA